MSGKSKEGRKREALQRTKPHGKDLVFGKVRFMPTVRAEALDVVVRMESTNGVPYTKEMDDWVNGGSDAEIRARIAATETKKRRCRI